MRGSKAKKLRKLAGFHPRKNRQEVRDRVVGTRKVGIISHTGDHRIENHKVVTAIAGPRRRLYKLMKLHHNNPEMMEVLKEMEQDIDLKQILNQNKGEENGE